MVGGEDRLQQGVEMFSLCIYNIIGEKILTWGRNNCTVWYVCKCQTEQISQ